MQGIDEFEECLVSIIEGMEGEIDFKEEVGIIPISLLSRDDLHIEIVVVDKEVYNLFNKYEVVSNDTM